MKFGSRCWLNLDKISPDAYNIVKTLQKEKFTAYLVGGCVRDLLLGISPKDFDISTTARPYQVKRILKPAYIIGKRFRLVLVKRGSQQFEVSTFRREALEEELLEEEVFDDFRGRESFKPLAESRVGDSRIEDSSRAEESEVKAEAEEMIEMRRRERSKVLKRDNIFGSPEEDARRRDFTINGIFYDPVSYELIDYVGGLDDLKKGVIRMIGEPSERLKEDSIRILRALRLAYKIRFALDSSLKQAMKEYAFYLKSSALPRRREELLKLLSLDDPSLPFLEAFDLGILKFLSSHINDIFLTSHRLEKFLTFLSSYYGRSLNNRHDHSQVPLELFSLLVLAYLKSKDLTSFKEKDGLFFMKEELGMFKYEQVLLLRALRLEKLLQNRLKLKNKVKSMNSLFREEIFPLALTLAKKNMSLSPEDTYFWKEGFKNYHKKNSASFSKVEVNVSSKR